MTELETLHAIDRARDAGWGLCPTTRKDIIAIPPKAIRVKYGLTDKGYVAGTTLQDVVRFIEGFDTAMSIARIHEKAQSQVHTRYGN